MTNYDLGNEATPERSSGFIVMDDRADQIDCTESEVVGNTTY
jgi:hypothetical protein